MRAHNSILGYTDTQLSAITIARPSIYRCLIMPLSSGNMVSSSMSSTLNAKCCISGSICRKWKKRSMALSQWCAPSSVFRLGGMELSSRSRALALVSAFCSSPTPGPLPFQTPAGHMRSVIHSICAVTAFSDVACAMASLSQALMTLLAVSFTICLVTQAAWRRTKDRDDRSNISSTRMYRFSLISFSKCSAAYCDRVSRCEPDDADAAEPWEEGVERDARRARG